jgi:hypothetical protein
MVFAKTSQPLEPVFPGVSPWQKLAQEALRTDRDQEQSEDIDLLRQHKEMPLGFEAQVQDFFDENETLGVMITLPSEATDVADSAIGWRLGESSLQSVVAEEYQEFNDYDRYIAIRKLDQEFSRLPHQQLLLCVLKLIPRVFPPDPLDPQRFRWEFLGHTYTYCIRTPQRGGLYLDQIPYPMLGFSEDKFTVFQIIGLPRLGSELLASVLIQATQSFFEPLREKGMLESLRMNELFAEDEYRFEFTYQRVVFYWEPSRNRIAVKLPGYLARCEYSSVRFGILVDWIDGKDLNESLAYLYEEGFTVLDVALNSLIDLLGLGSSEIPSPNPNQKMQDQENFSQKYVTSE